MTDTQTIPAPSDSTPSDSTPSDSTPSDSTPSDSTALVAEYFAAWNTEDEAARLAIARRVFCEDARYVDPLADATGPGAFVAMVSTIRDQHPGLSLRRSSELDTHHDCVRFGWEAVDGEGNVVIAGIDVAVLDDAGRLRSVTGFMGEPAALST